MGSLSYLALIAKLLYIQSEFTENITETNKCLEKTVQCRNKTQAIDLV